MSTVCPHCQAQVEPGDKFCGDCGGSVTAATAEPSAPKETPRGRRKLARGIGLVAVLALALAWFGGYLPASIPSWEDFRTRVGDSQESAETVEPETPGETTEEDVPDSEPPPPTIVPEGVVDPTLQPPAVELVTEELPPLQETVPQTQAEDEAVLLPLSGEEGLEDLPILFIINTEPEGARLYVEGEYRGTTPTLVEFDSIGVFQVRLELAGHADVLMDFDPREWGIEDRGFEDVVAITIPIGGANHGLSVNVPVLPQPKPRQGL